MGCGSSREENISPLSQSYKKEAGESIKVKRGGQLLQIEKILRLKNRPAKISSEIDVIQWDKLNDNSGEENSKEHIKELNRVFESPENTNPSAERSAEVSNSEDDPDIVSLQSVHPTFALSLDDAFRRSNGSQTSPVKDQSAFDWDLSDRTDIETQTNPPTRATSHKEEGDVEAVILEDAIVQTDQRLTYLLKKEDESRKKWNNSRPPNKGGPRTRMAGKKYKPTYVEAGVQTYIEVSSIGIQVDVMELRQLFGVHTQSKVPFNYEDMSDFSDADISTVHANSNPSTSHVKKRQLIKKKDGTFLGSPENSDPDEIILASEASIRSLAVSPVPMTVSDATFQTNMTVAAVASSNVNNGTMNIGKSGQKYNNNKNKKPIAGDNFFKIANPKSEKGVQTDKDITEESGGFKAEATTTKKFEIIGTNPALFDFVDEWVREISVKRYKSLKRIVKILVNCIEEEPSYEGIEDLIKVRAFYKWVTENIRYNSKYMDREMSTRDVLREKMGVCREYVKIFSEMCDIAGYRVKCIRGFAKGPNYIPGTHFGQGNDPPPHAWNAVYLRGGWRLVDCTWGAGQVNPETQVYEKVANEHFFLTDPDELIYTHFPYDEAETKYEKWQLLKQPITLEMFNDMPLLTSMFFAYSLKLPRDLPMPIVTNENIDIKILGYEVIRYRYRFHSVAKNIEELRQNLVPEDLNQYVMCYLKGKHRKIVNFHVTPPSEGHFLLKVYAKPEEEIANETDTLDHVATFHIFAPTIKAKPWPKPRTDLPWGLAQAWFDNTNAKIVGITGAPIIKMIGEKRKELMIKTPDERILSVCHIYDAEGNELVQDKDRDVKYTVLLSRKNPIPSSRGGEEGEDESSLLPFITKDENPERTIFTISDPPKEGFYKLQIFARRKPKKKGRLRIPLVANFLVEFRHSTQVVPQHVGVRASFSIGPSKPGLQSTPTVQSQTSLNIRSANSNKTVSSLKSNNDESTLSPVHVS